MGDRRTQCFVCGDAIDEDLLYDFEEDQEKQPPECLGCGGELDYCSSCLRSWRGCDYCEKDGTGEQAYCSLCYGEQRGLKECVLCDEPFGAKTRACPSCRQKRGSREPERNRWCCHRCTSEDEFEDEGEDADDGGSGESEDRGGD